MSDNDIKVYKYYLCPGCKGALRHVWTPLPGDVVYCDIPGKDTMQEATVVSPQEDGIVLFHDGRYISRSRASICGCTPGKGVLLCWLVQRCRCNQVDEEEV